MDYYKTWLRQSLWALILSVVFLSCQESPQPDNKEESTFKVAVVMPALHNNNWQKIVDLSIENLEEAQSLLSAKVRIDVEWIDENQSDLSLEFTRIW